MQAMHAGIQMVRQQKSYEQSAWAMTNIQTAVNSMSNDYIQANLVKQESHENSMNKRLQAIGAWR